MPFDTVDGLFYRIVPAHRAEQALAPAVTAEGRFHHSAQPTLYVSPRPDWACHAIAPYVQDGDPPRVICELHLTGSRILDLRNPTHCAAFGIDPALAAIPSARPTTAPMETSSYGYRRDPFNGALAFHSGVDFPGSYGQPILAAAPGTVSYVGPRQGYGNVVEVDHGKGLMTRYAHLSGYGVRAGQGVKRGEAIARMGSTGRSTGTHLHFEVRVNGAAVNPRPFLEARQDVLEVQQLAKRRIAGGRNRG